MVQLTITSHSGEEGVQAGLTRFCMEKLENSMKMGRRFELSLSRPLIKDYEFQKSTGIHRRSQSSGILIDKIAKHLN